MPAATPLTPTDLLSTRARTSTTSVIRDLLRLVDRPDVLSLAGGLPAAELLPVARLREAMERVASPRALQYAPTEGVSELREVIAARAGAGARPADVVVTTGSQQGLDLAARCLLDPGDVVVVEAPSYLGSLQSFRANGATIVSVRGDGHGLDVDELAARLAEGLRPKVVSVVPNFANPSGATLSLERRHALVDLADRYGFVVIEDDPYGELRWSGSALPRLVDLAPDRVISLGSASKVLAPGLRLGWMRGPSWLLDAAVRLKQSADLHTSSLDQMLAADVLGDDAFMSAHLASIRGVYRDRAAALVDALVPLPIEAAMPDGGMFVWARLTGARDSAVLFERAIDAGVSFVPGVAFDADGRPSDRLRLCFCTLGPSDLARGAARLGGAIASAA